MQFKKRWRGNGLKNKRRPKVRSVRMEAGGSKTPKYITKRRNRAAAKRAKQARKVNR